MLSEFADEAAIGDEESRSIKEGKNGRQTSARNPDAQTP
jgi:hypothetical protein